ncbi:MAG TPA: hypothetical protein VMO26_12740 [Vicinamibacterales bacterium]|nr:hypothetical protein [Vicinamibacterales bacterium]
MVNFGPIELLVVLAIWMVPMAVTIWFMWAIHTIVKSLRSIEERLERLESARRQP